MIKRILLPALALCLAVTAAADDNEATAAYMAGRTAYEAGDYRDAAGKFEDAELLGDSTAVKANSVLAQISAWRMCGLLYREFEAIEKLLTSYPEYADFVALVQREYAIGEAYYQGRRDPSFWSLRWIPWLVDDDKSIEVFEKTLSRAPFAENAPGARLRLAYLFDQKGELQKSLEQLRLIIRDFPDSPECKYAYLALGTGLYQLSQRGDGDGRYNQEAMDAFKTFQEKYPDASENDWVKRHLMLGRDIQAARLLSMAKYYAENGRKAAAERYLAQVLQEYPDTLSADASEALLVKLDRTFVPEELRPDPASRLPRIVAYPLPQEAEKLLIAPGEGSGKFLLPVFDLSGQLKSNMNEASKEDAR